VCFVAGCSDYILWLPVLLKFIALSITEIVTAAHTTAMKEEPIKKILLSYSKKGKQPTQSTELIFYQSKIANRRRHIESDVLLIRQRNSLSSLLLFTTTQNTFQRQIVANILAVAPSTRIKEQAYATE